MDIIAYLVVFLVSYLIGSITFALVFAKLWGYPDPRTCGSTNAGATNMLRVSSKSVALLTLLCDALKGGLVVLMASCLGMPEEVALLAGYAAFIGHLFPVYYSFKGGKGVATGMGVIIAFSPLLALYACIIWFVIYMSTFIVSLASIGVFWSMPLLAYFYYGPTVSAILLLFTVFITYAHRNNVVRLWLGMEVRTTLFESSSKEENYE